MSISKIVGAKAQLYGIIVFAVIVIAFIAIVYFAGKKSGGKAKPVKAKKLPNSGSGIPQGWNVDAYVQEFYDSFSGVFGSQEKKLTILSKMEGMTDDQLTAMYNRFNQVHGDGDTLYDWINEEWTLAFTNHDERITQRMRDLGLIDLYKN